MSSGISLWPLWRGLGLILVLLLGFPTPGIFLRVTSVSPRLRGDYFRFWLRLAAMSSSVWISGKSFIRISERLLDPALLLSLRDKFQRTVQHCWRQPRPAPLPTPAPKMENV